MAKSWHRRVKRATVGDQMLGHGANAGNYAAKELQLSRSVVLDCQWLQRLHSYGLLTASFRPADQVVVLRSYLRQRQMLIRYAGQHVHYCRSARKAIPTRGSNRWKGRLRAATCSE